MRKRTRRRRRPRRWRDGVNGAMAPQRGVAPTRLRRRVDVFTRIRLDAVSRADSFCAPVCAFTTSNSAARFSAATAASCCATRSASSASAASFAALAFDAFSLSSAAASLASNSLILRSSSFLFSPSSSFARSSIAANLSCLSFSIIALASSMLGLQSWKTWARYFGSLRWLAMDAPREKFLMDREDMAAVILDELDELAMCWCCESIKLGELRTSSSLVLPSSIAHATWKAN